MPKKRQFSRWNEGMDASLIDMYNSGECSSENMAEKLGVTYPTINAHMRLLNLPRLGEAGCKLRNHRSYGPRYNEVVFSKEQENLIALRNSEGVHDTEIARELGMPYRPTNKLRIRLNLPTNDCTKPIPIGTRYESVVVIGELGSEQRKKGGNSGASRSSCRCDCGKEFLAFNEDLRSGHVTTCGCRINRQNPDAEWVRVFHSVVGGARSRNLPMELSLIQVKHLGLLPCFYCGVEGSNTMAPHKSKNINRMPIKYNGIDQVVPCGGYKPGNVLSCCSACNRAKSDQALDRFLPWVIRLHGKNFTVEEVMNSARSLGEGIELLTEGQCQQE